MSYSINIKNMNYLKIIAVSIITTLALCLNTSMYAVESPELTEDDNDTLVQIQEDEDTEEDEALIWLDDKEEVFKLAKEQNKLIFLLSGRTSCGICNRTRAYLDTTTNLRQMVDDNYIMWFSNYDSPPEKAEVLIYIQHLLNGGAKTLPLVAIINPNEPNVYVSSYWGSRSATFLETFLEEASEITPNEVFNSQDSKAAIFNNRLFVSNNIDNETISIFTITGQKIYTIQKKEQSINIDASSLPNGILILNSSKGWSSKVIK